MTASPADLIDRAKGIVQQRITAAEKATPGPWWADGSELYGGTYDRPHFDDNGHHVWIGETCNGALPDEGDANATHIANHSPDKVIGLWTRALTQLDMWTSDEEISATEDMYERGWKRATQVNAGHLATAIVGSHDE